MVSKKDIVIKRIIKSIADGIYKIGDKLPPERALSEEYGISRVIVHSAIVDLNAKGLLEIAPRKGVIVKDYERNGNLDLLEIMITAIEDQNSKLLLGLLDTRKLLEEEFASLAAVNRQDTDIATLKSIIEKEAQALDTAQSAQLDFSFHHEIAHSTGNPIYPLLLKSMEHTYKRLIKEFYDSLLDRDKIINQHRLLLDAIIKQDNRLAQSIMHELIDEGAKYIINNRLN